MKTYHANEMGSVAILGHLKSGKTSVIEAMVYRSGGSTRIGSVNQGNTISDFDEEEIKRQTTINASIIPIEWNHCKINLIDTPGNTDFVGEVNQALNAAQSAVIVVPPTKEITVGTKISMEKTEGMPRILYINGIDSPNSAYKEKLELLKETFGKAIAPIQVPIIEDNKMVGYVNVAKMEGRRFVGEQTEVANIPEDMWDEIMPIKEMIDEAVANSRDDLLEKYFNEEPFTKEEISWALRQGVSNRSIIPVLCGSQNIGIQILLNSMVAFFPASGDMANSFMVKNVDTNTEDIIGYNEQLPVSLFVFKTVADPFMGRISYFKVATGMLKAPISLYNSTNKEVEKITKFYIPKGKELIETDMLCAGDIGVLTKLQYTKTNDTLCTLDYRVIYEPIDFPTPYYTKAIEPKGKDNEEKISQVITKLVEEDQTLAFTTNPETKQQLLSGMGKQHLEITISKLKNKFKLEVELKEVLIPYRETIRSVVTSRAKYKKQTGGHGQYGEVELTFEPSWQLKIPYIFEEKVYGGAVPRSYFPAVEKGIQESIKEGVLARYPVIGLKATLIDGSYHNVDSSELAFKTATMMAFKEGIFKASPALLEPYMKMKVYVHSDYTGDVMSDLNSKRARVNDVNHFNDIVIIDAEVPQNEVMEYAVELKAITQGLGNYELEFLDYEIAPDPIAKKIIEQRKQ